MEQPAECAYVVTIEIDIAQIDAETTKQAEYAAILDLGRAIRNGEGLSRFRVSIRDCALKPLPVK